MKKTLLALLLLCHPSILLANEPTAQKTIILDHHKIKWEKKPRVQIRPVELGIPTLTTDQKIYLYVKIKANENGDITSSQIMRSSGFPKLDRHILSAISKAKFQPYIENGIAYPFTASQPFEIYINAEIENP